MTRVAAAIVAGLLSVSAAAAHPTGTSGAKPETACTTSLAATTGSGEEKTANGVGASVRSSIDHLRPGFLRTSEQLDIELATREQHVIERFVEIC